MWGDFKITLNYIDNSLDLGFITDHNQDTIGRLNSSQVLMLVPSISQEEIDQLEPGKYYSDEISGYFPDTKERRIRRSFIIMQRRGFTIRSQVFGELFVRV